MNIMLPEALEKRLTPAQAVLHLAVGLFASGEATLGQAAETSGLTQAEFMRELGRRRIPLHYGTKEFAEDLVTIETLRPL
jgi:predicted HTH domain antitoxin